MSIDKTMLDYSLVIFGCIENLFNERNTFFQSLMIQVEEELEIFQEIKESLVGEIEEKTHELNELKEEIIFCNYEIAMLNNDLINLEQTIASFTKQVVLDSQDLKLNGVNQQDFEHHIETRQALRNSWLELELINQTRIETRLLRNQVRKNMNKAAEICRQTKNLIEELKLTITEDLNFTISKVKHDNLSQAT